jgi:hypothetical protein
MTSATAQKAAAILAEGRLTVTEVGERVVKAVCRGSAGQVYELGLNAGGWCCSCPAGVFGRPCSHLDALKRVTIVNRPGRTAPEPGPTQTNRLDGPGGQQ